MGKFIKQENRIIENCGDCLKIDVSTPTLPSAIMLIDSESWNKIQLLGIGRIHAEQKKTKKTAYARCKLKGKMVFIHRLILPEAKMIDHINQQGLDNRLSNLRSCSASENQANKSIQANNSSGFKGIRFHKRDKKFEAYISTNGKRKYLGLFETVEAAHEVYKQASLKLHGSFSIYYNHN